MVLTLPECAQIRLPEDYFPEMRSAFSEEQRLYCSVYVRNSFRFLLLHGYLVFVPWHHQDLNSFPLRNISSDAATMPPHLQTSLSDLQGLLNNTPVYAPVCPLF